MLHAGRTTTLRIRRIDGKTVLLEGGEAGLIHLHNPPADARPDQELEVFLYHDHDGQLTATTDRPLLQAGEFAFLSTVPVTDDGAFMDWGLLNDLYIPPREQQTPLCPGLRALVHAMVDRVNGRMIGSTRIDRYLADSAPGYRIGSPVALLIREETGLGYKAIVDNRCGGVLYRDEVFRPLKPGERLPGYIKKVREDGKLDLTLREPGFARVGGIREAILEALRQNEGFLPMTDKSPPEEIRRRFGESKKSFKMAIGTLYREKTIALEPNGIRLLNP